MRIRQIRSDELLHLVELDEFSEDWSKLDLDVEVDLWHLQMESMFGPDAVPVIAGTGGLRKMRFAPTGWHTGKRGAVPGVLRVLSKALARVACNGVCQGSKGDDFSQRKARYSSVVNAR